MKHILARRIAAGVLCMGLIVSFTPSARRIAAVPGHIIVPAGRADALSGVTGEPTGSAAVLASGDERLNSQDDYVTLSMWGVPVRRVSVSVSEARMVIPGGHSIGVALRTRGVLVVGVSGARGRSARGRGDSGHRRRGCKFGGRVCGAD